MGHAWNRVAGWAGVGLVNWMAPQSRADLLRKALIFLALINLLNWAATAVRGVPYALGADLGNTTAVALPFVLFILAVLRRQRELQAQLAAMASTDLLTGLPNRRDFMSRARLATEGGRAGALLLLDADHFKRINDAFGHAAGDACLAAIAARLRAQLRPGDLVGRLGGEEFAVFLPGATREVAAETGGRLCAAISVEAAAAEERLAVTLSAGAALGDGVIPLDRLMADADRALYVAKARGRGRVVMWPPGEAPDAEAA